MATSGWENVTESDVAKFTRKTQAIAAAPKPSKYHNRITYADNIRFDSKREAEFWIALRTREQAGEIYDLQRQVPFELSCPIHANYPAHITTVVCEYVADFTWRDCGTQLRHVIDVKTAGTRTQLYRLKRKWMQLEHGITVEEM